MINQVCLLGRLEVKKELKITRTNSYVMNFIVSVPNRLESLSKMKMSYIHCIAFGKSAKNINDYCEEGMIISIVGSLQDVQKEFNGRKYKSIYILADFVSIYSKMGASSDEVASIPIDVTEYAE